MAGNTDAIRRKRSPGRSPDTFDRKILAALVTDSSQSYAMLGEKVGLSAPAVHERVKRMRKTGVIMSTSARIDGAAVSKPMLAFVHVDTTGWGKSQRLLKMSEFPEVEEMHSVAGDTCMILKVRTRGPQDLENLLSQLYVIPGVVTSRSYVVLSTYLERPIQADFTSGWPESPLPVE